MMKSLAAKVQRSIALRFCRIKAASGGAVVMHVRANRLSRRRRVHSGHDDRKQNDKADKELAHAGPLARSLRDRN